MLNEANRPAFPPQNIDLATQLLTVPASGASTSANRIPVWLSIVQLFRPVLMLLLNDICDSVTATSSSSTSKAQSSVSVFHSPMVFERVFVVLGRLLPLCPQHSRYETTSIYISDSIALLSLTHCFFTYSLSLSLSCAVLYWIGLIAFVH
jgi:hypothetical protein